MIFKDAKLNVMEKSESWFFANDSLNLNDDEIECLLP